MFADGQGTDPLNQASTINLNFYTVFPERYLYSYPCQVHFKATESQELRRGLLRAACFNEITNRVCLAPYVSPESERRGACVRKAPT